VKLAHFNIKKKITVLVALFTVLQLLVKIKKNSIIFTKKSKMKKCANFANLARHIPLQSIKKH